MSLFRIAVGLLLAAFVPVLVSASSLQRIVGSARVVALGEADHGVPELRALRNEVFFELVERLGFTAIAVETGFAESVAVDDYVTVAQDARAPRPVPGEGALTNETASAVFSFAAPTVFPENVRLIEWMRAYNEKPQTRRKIRFYGIEMIGGVDGQGHPFVRKPFDEALRYLALVDPDEARALTSRMTPVLQHVSTVGYENLPVASQEALSLGAADVLSLFERRHLDWLARATPLQYQRGLRNALNARNAVADLRAGGWWSLTRRDRNQRDASSAESVRWVLDQEGPAGKVLVFAHSAHVRKGKSTAGDEPPFTSLGQHLAATLGDSLIVIGTAYARDQSAPRMKDLRSMPPNARHAIDACECFDALISVSAKAPRDPRR